MVVLFQVDFALRDARLPHDANAALMEVPTMAASLEAGRVGEGLAPVLSPGGWQELCIVGIGLATGRSPLAWHAWFTGWLLVGGWGVVRTARAIRADAELPALALYLGFPVLLDESRMGWVHLPELALVALGTAELVEAEEELSLGAALRVAVGVALLGTLRGSGLGWGLALAAAALWRLRGRWGPVAAVLAGCGVGALVTGPTLPVYAGEKVLASARYAFLGGPEALLVLLQSLGVVQAGVLAVGLGLAVTRWPMWRRPALLALGGVGLGPPLVSMFVLASPVTNTPVFLAAAAVVGGVGLALLGRWGVAAALIGWLPLLPLQLVPGDAFAKRPWPRSLVRYFEDDPQNYQRPFPYDVSVALVEPLTACAARYDPCLVVAESGIFTPSPEVPGRLELYFLGLDTTRFALLTPLMPPSGSHVDVVTRYRCENSARAWEMRHPEYAAAADALIRSSGLAHRIEIPAGPGCSYGWFERP